MPEGPIEQVNVRLIPFPYDTPLQNGETPRMYDIKIADVTNTFDAPSEETIVKTAGIYTVFFGFWGFVYATYDELDAAQCPADGVTEIILTIQEYRVSSVDGTRISTIKGPLDVTITGVAVAADTTDPIVLSVSPTGSNIALGSQVTIFASEETVEGTGNYYIYDVTGSVLLETIAAASATYVLSQVILTPVVSQNNNNQYSLRMDAGVFEDAAGNPVAAITDNTYSWTTVASGGGGGGGTPLAPDATVSSLTALYAQLSAWSGANWNGSTPAGKTNTDFRVVGLNASTSGQIVLNGYTFPQNVYIRHVGTFTNTAAGVASCSVFHTHAGTGAGGSDSSANRMTNCTNLWITRMDFRATSSGSTRNELWYAALNTGGGFLRNTFKGFPFDVSPTSTARGITTYGIIPDRNTDFTILNNAYYYFKDGFTKTFGQENAPSVDGNMGNYIGGDDYTIGVAGSGWQQGHLVDPLFRCNFYARNRAMSGTAAAPNHNDCIQFNGNAAGSRATRFNSEYDVAYRGRWTGVALLVTGEAGWGGYWTNGAGSAVSTGPHKHKHCLFLNGHNRCITGFNGGGLTVEYCATVQHDNDQPPNAAWPYIRNVATSTANFCTGPSGAYNTNPGTGGLLLNMGGNSNGTGANYNLLLTYFTNIPTNYTDLWDIRPPSGAVTHPDFTPSNQRIGPWELWQKLFNGDADIVLSKVGWPVAGLFIADFDRGDNFWGSYTGNYDSDGNNV